MKEKVAYSAGAATFTALMLAITAALTVYFYLSGQTYTTILLVIALAGWCAATVYYMPRAISADEKELKVHRPLRAKRFSYSDIASVKPILPTLGERRICGSGGFLGYWGWFSDDELGRYFAYYGKASDCFLITLRNGRKYMLGCRNARRMADFVNARCGK